MINIPSSAGSLYVFLGGTGGRRTVGEGRKAGMVSGSNPSSRLYSMNTASNSSASRCRKDQGGEIRGDTPL